MLEWMNSVTAILTVTVRIYSAYLRHLGDIL